VGLLCAATSACEKVLDILGIVCIGGGGGGDGGGGCSDSTVQMESIYLPPKGQTKSKDTKIECIEKKLIEEVKEPLDFKASSDCSSVSHSNSAFTCL